MLSVNPTCFNRVASLRKISIPFKCLSYLQETCQGVTNIVVSLAENHTKLILDCSLEQDETKKSNMIKLTHLVLVSDYSFNLLVCPLEVKNKPQLLYHIFFCDFNQNHSQQNYSVVAIHKWIECMGKSPFSGHFSG